MNSDNTHEVLSLKKEAPAADDAGPINLIVQGRRLRYDGVPNLWSLLVSRGENSLYVNVRINGEVLDTRDFESVPVKEGDRIDFLYFMGGGSIVRPDRRRN